MANVLKVASMVSCAKKDVMTVFVRFDNALFKEFKQFKELNSFSFAEKAQEFSCDKKYKLVRKHGTDPPTRKHLLQKCRFKLSEIEKFKTK